MHKKFLQFVLSYTLSHTIFVKHRLSSTFNANYMYFYDNFTKIGSVSVSYGQ